MAKYGQKAQEKVETTMRERKKGTLKSGSGQKVTSRKQAIAIGLSEARAEGGKVPKKKAAKKKTAKKKTATKKTARKTASKKRSSTSRSNSTRSSATKNKAAKKKSAK